MLQLQSSERHCKNVVDALRHNEALPIDHRVHTYNVDETVFNVDEGYESVNLPKRFCQYGKFKPFNAAVAALHVRQNPFQYVDDVFLTTNLVQAYSFPWQLIGNEQVIPPSVDLVLILDRSMLCAKGRSKSTKIRNKMDEVETNQSCIKCGICKQPGYNRKNCPNCGANQ